MNKITLGIMLASSTLTAQAQNTDVAPMIRGEHVIETPESEYRDYLVKISTPNGSCGGGLIAGRFILTAAHCAEVEGHITIWQDVNTGWDSNNVYSTTYKLHTVQRGKEYAERLTYTRDMYESLGYIEVDVNGDGFTRNVDSGLPYWFDFLLDKDYIEEVRNYDTNKAIGTETNKSFEDHLGNKYNLFLDLAILELEEPILHNSSFALGFIRDENFQQIIPNGQTFTFNGWGQTGEKPEDYYYPTRLMQGELELTASEMYDNCPPEEIYCYSPFKPTLLFTHPEDDGQGVGSGDSGTPIILNNVAYGVGSTVSMSTPYQSRFYEFAPHKQFILNAINEVTTPQLDIIKVPVIGNGQSFDYVIQNFTNNTATIDIAESGSVIAEGYAVINHDCRTQLNSFEYCTVNMDIRKSGFGYGSYTGKHNFTIAVINGIPRTTAFDIPSVTTTIPLEDGDSLNNNGTNINIDSNGNSSVNLSHAEGSLYIEFSLGTSSTKISEVNYTVRDSDGTIYGQCAKDAIDDIVTCVIEGSELATGNSHSYTFTLYEGETSMDELSVNVTTTPSSTSGGTSSGGGGGSFGPFGALLISLAAFYRRRK
ncbi:trypsin-like serine protease [Vibrio barjaei]|uniref:trypsin-like serine protease n=1 Tax=Vibrio barjaei TaxID=1676683 RepID=UPI00228515E9|nr:trypsin-like serine protease [Vibrio barjaei]MCY9870417.1 trypsin-like serine protease [Vibrio barjaei]